MRQFLLCLNDNKYKKVNEAYVDGYAVGDRLLEGVVFRITLEGNKFKASTPAEFVTYMEDLNEKKWLKEVEKFCENNDVYHAKLSDVGVGFPTDDVVCYDDEKALDEQTFGCSKKPDIIA